MWSGHRLPVSRMRNGIVFIRIGATEGQNDDDRRTIAPSAQMMLLYSGRSSEKDDFR